MKKEYQTPSIEVKNIECLDVLTSSKLNDPNVPDDGWG